MPGSDVPVAAPGERSEASLVPVFAASVDIDLRCVSRGFCELYAADRRDAGVGDQRHPSEPACWSALR